MIHAREQCIITLEPHMYRNINDPVAVPDIATFIDEQLHRSNNQLHESLFLDDPAFIDAAPAREKDEDSDEDDKYNAELVKERLINALDAYKDKILNLHQENTQDPSMNKAIMAFTKTLNKSLRCTPSTIQKQMHEFGKGNEATNRTNMEATSVSTLQQ